MSTTPLDTNFKDDILASSNAKRKYQMTYNDDGTVSFQDATAYSQMGSAFGAKEVNEERAAINKINSDRIVTLDEIDLVTEPGFFVDAMAVKELNRNFKIYNSKIVLDNNSWWPTVTWNEVTKIGNLAIINFRGLYTSSLPKSGGIGTLPEGFRPKKDFALPSTFLGPSDEMYIGDIVIHSNGYITFGVSVSGQARWVTAYAVFNI